MKKAKAAGKPRAARPQSRPHQIIDLLAGIPRVPPGWEAVIYRHGEVESFSWRAPQAHDAECAYLSRLRLWDSEAGMPCGEYLAARDIAAAKIAEAELAKVAAAGNAAAIAARRKQWLELRNQVAGACLACAMGETGRWERACAKAREDQLPKPPPEDGAKALAKLARAIIAERKWREEIEPKPVEDQPRIGGTKQSTATLLYREAFAACCWLLRGCPTKEQVKDEVLYWCLRKGGRRKKGEEVTRAVASDPGQQSRDLKDAGLSWLPNAPRGSSVR